MTIRFGQLLYEWYSRRDAIDWALGTIIDTHGSTYRKTGAMMLFNNLGQSFGMLSGGCVEGDLLANAHKTITAKQIAVVRYDLRDDSDSYWQRGLGCGGAMTVLLQPIDAANNYLGLELVHQALSEFNNSIYLQRIDKHGLTCDDWQVLPCDTQNSALFDSRARSTCKKILRDNGQWLASLICPAPHLMIFGGGRDARPLARLAKEIGWRVTVIDKRIGHGRTEDFPGATVIKRSPEELSDRATHKVDAMVIMNHSLSLDAQSLAIAHCSEARYVGILGPEHRRQKVETIAGLTTDDFHCCYRGPIGIDIGARLPETIALAVLAECHHVIEGDAGLGQLLTTRKIEGAEK